MFTKWIQFGNNVDTNSYKVETKVTKWKQMTKWRQTGYRSETNGYKMETDRSS